MTHIQTHIHWFCSKLSDKDMGLMVLIMAQSKRSMNTLTFLL